MRNENKEQFILKLLITHYRLLVTFISEGFFKIRKKTES